MKLSTLFVFVVLLGLFAVLTGVLLGMLGLLDIQRQRALALLKKLLNGALFCGMAALIVVLALSRPRTAVN
ncbi:MAG: hypothetical protein JNM56_01590 [Planctomycetia bacterium]|nr:hypothetical protein [Planctomycetia bacterium]